MRESLLRWLFGVSSACAVLVGVTGSWESVVALLVAFASYWAVFMFVPKP